MITKETVDKEIRAIEALLAGRPLTAIHEAKRLEQVRLRLGDIQIYLAGIPVNDRPFSIVEVRNAANALTQRGQTAPLYDLFGFGEVARGEAPPGPGNVGGRPQAVALRPQPVARAGGEFGLCLRSVAVGVATIVTAGLLLYSLKGGARGAS